MAVRQSHLAPEGFYAFQSPAGESDLRGAAEYALKLPAVRKELGDPPDAGAVAVEEVGDGNLNLVFIVRAGEKGIVLKQALPYVRVVGEGWPLSVQRSVYEHKALLAHRAMAPKHVPEVFHMDPRQGIIVMQYIAPPHTILRGALMEQRRFPTLSADMGEYLARTLFLSSDLHLSSAAKRQAECEWGFTELSRLTEDVIFTDPFIGDGGQTAFPNKCTPGLAGAARALTEDLPLKAAVRTLKERFLCSREALIHGDLHTGSVMVKEGSTIVIDPEFAMYGPMGFDIGCFQANILLSYFAHWGHSKHQGGDRSAYLEWLLAVLQDTWAAFTAAFLALWADPAARAGDLCKGCGEAELAAVREQYLARLHRDALGFAGCEMIRRTVGVAHVADLESISDEGARAQAEQLVLATARRMVADPCGSLSGGWGPVAALAREAAQRA